MKNLLISFVFCISVIISVQANATDQFIRPGLNVGDTLQIQTYDESLNIYKTIISTTTSHGNPTMGINSTILIQPDGRSLQSLIEQVDIINFLLFDGFNNLQYTSVGGLYDGFLYPAMSTLSFNSAAQMQTELNDALSLKANESEMTSLTYTSVSGLSTVAHTGIYSDLSGKPSLFSGDYPDLTNKPSLFSGSYLNLTNVPSSFTPSSHMHPVSDISDSTSVGRSVVTAANAGAARTAIGAGTSSFSGSYTDLSGKPTIPAAYLIGTPNSRSMSLSTAYQCTDNTKPCVFTITTNCPLNTALLGSASCSGEIRIGSANTVSSGASGTVMASLSRSASGLSTLLTQTYSDNDTTTISVPVGWYISVRQPSGSGLSVQSAFDQATQ